MPIVNDQYRIAFFGIPKIATTTIKMFFYELQFGELAANDVKWEDKVHRFYPTDGKPNDSDFAEYRDYFRFSIVRDPVKRLLSTYSNRINYHKDTYVGKLSRTRAFLLGVPRDPDPDTFFQNLNRYRLQSGVMRHHLALQGAYIGDDLSRFDAVYPIEEMERCRQKLAEITGNPDLKFRRLQTEGAKLQLSEISKKSYEAMLEFCASDYELLKQYYQPPPYPGS